MAGHHVWADVVVQVRPCPEPAVWMLDEFETKSRNWAKLVYNSATFEAATRQAASRKPPWRSARLRWRRR